MPFALKERVERQLQQQVQERELVDLSLLRFYVCYIKLKLCPFWTMAMLCGLPVVHCIPGVSREFTQNLVRLYHTLLDLKLSLIERRTYHTSVQVFKILY